MLLLLFILISFFVLTPEPTKYPSYVSNSPAPDGVKAFYTYLEKEKLPVERWFYAADLLPKSVGNQVLLMVEPNGVYISKKSVQKPYEEFMEAGNTIILFTTSPNGRFHLKSEHSNKSSLDYIRVKDREGNEYKADYRATFVYKTIKSDEVLLSNENGPIAIKRPFGKGQLIALNSPEWVTNENILKHDHIPLILSLLNEGNVKNADTILIDEYMHGFGKTAYSVYPKWVLLLFVQCALVMVLLLWMQGKRFGPILLPREEFVRFTDERIQALAAWHMRCQLFKDSLFVQADYVKVQLQERWGIPYKTDWIDAAGTLERKWITVSALEIRRFLHELTKVLEKEKITKQEYLLWSKKLEQLRKEVEEG
ncbi:MAG TPA: DUF4350 domain-containing protein [Bacillus bacterium]|nr:DUF4350 domain-containing protein [Bacillus sp. (in: firmicutes)]